MAYRDEDRALALAGVVQAASQIGTAAHTGMVSQDSFEVCLRSLFVFNPASTLDIYGGTDALRPGLKLADTLLSSFNPGAHADTVRYTLSMMAVERSLARHPDLFRYLGSQLQTIGGDLPVESGDNEADQDAGNVDDLVDAVAVLYQETISTIEPRIRIMGSRRQLQNDINVQRIRALLLAGIRSAVLWHQVGGRRWQLLFARKSLRLALARAMTVNKNNRDKT